MSIPGKSQILITIKAAGAHTASVTFIVIVTFMYSVNECEEIVVVVVGVISGSLIVV